MLPSVHRELHMRIENAWNVLNAREHLKEFRDVKNDLGKYNGIYYYYGELIKKFNSTVIFSIESLQYKFAVPILFGD